MGFLNTTSASERINAAFERRKTLTMEEVIEAIVTDPKALEYERTMVHGGPLSVESARVQVEIKVECVFNHLFDNGLIAPVRAKDKRTLGDFWGPDSEPSEEPDCYRFGLHPIKWKANSKNLPRVEGFDL